MPEKNRFPAVLQPAIAFPANLSATQHASAEDLAPAMGAKNPTAVAFSCKDYGGDAGPISPTLRSMGHDGSHANAGGQAAVAFDVKRSLAPHGLARESETAFPLAASDHKDPQFTRTDMQVRRLMPVECERLQGFPENHTRIPTWNGWRKIDASEKPEQLEAEGLEVRQNKKTGKWRVKDVDGPRYKAIGNSWAVPVARWIGSRIQQAVTSAS